MLENNEDIDKKLAEISKEKTTNPVVDNSNEAIASIEKSVAEVSESETASEEKAIEKVVYSQLTLEALVVSLKKLISEHPVQKIKSELEALKIVFNEKFGTLLAEKKALFIEEGGNSIDFHFPSPIKKEFNTLLSDYKKARDKHYKDLEKQQKENLTLRLEVIENLKELIENAESSTMYKKYKALDTTWKSIGSVSRNHYNDTWKTYHHHVERFYDLLNLSNDFRDLDFKNNLKEKLKIIEKAEQLSTHENGLAAFKELQKLHKIWKEDIGPVPRDSREEVWKKFSDLTKIIHDRKDAHYKEVRADFEVIIQKKLVIVKTIEDMDLSNFETHSEWQKGIKMLEKLRQEYFDLGKLPFSKSEEIWQQFKAVTKKFNSAKNNFYKTEKNKQEDNLKKKLALIEIAESIKNNENWEETTQKMKEIQTEWKTIGYVPRKNAKHVWSQFKEACNYYFDRLKGKKKVANEHLEKSIIEKKKFIESMNSMENLTKESLVEVINNWRDLGQVPRNFRYLDDKFSKVVDKLIASLNLETTEAAMFRFKIDIDGYFENENYRQLDSEQISIRKNMDEYQKEIQQLENNLGFFSNAEDDNPLVINVKNKIVSIHEKLAIWKSKLNYIRNLNY